MRSGIIVGISCLNLPMMHDLVWIVTTRTPLIMLQPQSLHGNEGMWVAVLRSTTDQTLRTIVASAFACDH